MKKSSRRALCSAHSLLLFLLCALIAWIVMAQGNFFYGLWHDHAGIREGIEEYGPKNRYKQGFGDTTRDERMRIFAAINFAIHNDGEGLRDIRYQTPTSNGSQRVFREAEVVHLQDVANLINVLQWFCWLVFFAWLAVVIAYAKTASYLVSVLWRFSGPLVLLIFIGLTLLAFGAENVFNTLHVWVFPDEHQWFFYYQDSLMSTMMLAPELFAWIAATWAVLSLIVFAGLNSGISKVLYWRSKTTSV